MLLSDSRAVVRLVQQAMQPEGGSAQVRQDKGAHRDLKDTMNKELFDLISEQTLNDEALRPAERDFVLAACEDRLGSMRRRTLSRRKLRLWSLRRRRPCSSSSR